MHYHSTTLSTSITTLSRYPDIVMDGGSYYTTESYKSKPTSEVKTHDIDDELVVLLLEKRTINALATKGLVASATPTAANRSLSLRPGTLPDFATYPLLRYGITIDMWLRSARLTHTHTQAQTQSQTPHRAGQRQPVEAEALLACGGGALTIVRMANGTTKISLRAHNARGSA